MRYGLESSSLTDVIWGPNEETIYLFTAYGPVVFYNDDGSVDQILSHENILEIVEGAAQHYTAAQPKSAA